MAVEQALDPAPEIEAGAIRLLAQREHSRKELARKLRRRFADEGVIGQVLDDLAERGLLSDVRFAENYVAQRMRRGYGPLRIRAELQERGVEEALIEAQLDIGQEEWMALLREVAARRFGAADPAGQKEQARRARFLQYRGFPESLVRRYLWA